MGVGDETVATANAIAREVRERTAPQRERLASALLALNMAAAYQSRDDVSGEIERATSDRVTFAAANPGELPEEAAKRKKYPGTTLSKRFLPQTLQKQIAGRSLTWAAVTSEDLLRTIETTVLEGLTSGAADTDSIKARLNSVFRGWVDDGEIDPTTGDKLTKAAKLEAIARTRASASYNAGRLDLMMDPETDVVNGVAYSAIRDGRTSDFCNQWDGVKIAKTPENEILIRELNPPNHLHERAFMVPLTTYEEWEPTPPSQYPKIQPMRGFGVIPGLEGAKEFS